MQVRAAAMRRHLLLLTFTVAVPSFLAACGDETPAADGGTGDASTLDTGPPDSGEIPTSTIALVSATSGDGLHVVAELAGPIDPASAVAASFEVRSESGGASFAVSAVTLEGDRARLTLAGALPKGPPYVLAAPGLRDRRGVAVDAARANVPLAGTLHLAMIWHQHQPLYLDPDGDYLRGPWVRKHATKDYYDMAATVGAFPDVHVMVNLTPVLLNQLEKYYLARLSPFVNVAARTIDAAGYFAQKTGVVTDPWLDLLLAPTPRPEDLTEQQRGWFYRDIWSSFSISDPLISRFPAYAALRDKRDASGTFTQDDLLQMKGWFELAWFDPDFLRGPVTLPGGEVVDLSDLVREDANGLFTLRAPFTEDICKRLVVEGTRS